MWDSKRFSPELSSLASEGRPAIEEQVTRVTDVPALSSEQFRQVFFKGIPDGRSPQFSMKVETLKNATIELASGSEVESVFKGRKIDGRLVDHIRGLSRSDLEEIDTWFPEDSVHVRYKSDESSPWSPISEGSPGQRTAALLAFVLSMGTEPLILDQPEDDLENQLIYSLVVGTLRSIKSCRQVIVVTHNANIVVNGNAENVIVLQRSAETTSIHATGALERKDVRSAVCQIMEGGEAAFTKRFERLGIKLPSHIGALR
ncbi:AAA family ATPase [Pseudarthrobacter albicanus]|uniref:AAA family ATPase n=1 Tax=Pseudarthrobacter albicanus TaxID=2823873 RepID=UPI001BA7EEAB|nr:AAA family ATPase [Pseudarthrobacter albicanus]